MSAQPDNPSGGDNPSGVNAPAVFARPGFRYGLWLADLRGIQEEFYGYRDYAPVGPDEKRGSGQILPFVRGLYLSARIIYFIRDVLRSKQLHVNWGHIVHESQIYCSPECDIIIHRLPAMKVWDGRVLDFHFVDAKHVLAVVSCKSEVASVDEDYSKKLLAFGVPQIGLVGEVASRTNFINLRSKAKAAGYVDLWCLALEDAIGRGCDEPTLVEFIKFLESL